MPGVHGVHGRLALEPAEEEPKEELDIQHQEVSAYQNH